MNVTGAIQQADPAALFLEKVVHIERMFQRGEPFGARCRASFAARIEWEPQHLDQASARALTCARLGRVPRVV